MNLNYNLLFIVFNINKNKDSHEDKTCIDKRYIKLKDLNNIIKCD